MGCPLAELTKTVNDAIAKGAFDRGQVEERARRPRSRFKQGCAHPTRVLN